MEIKSKLYKTDEDIIREYNLTEDEKVYLLPELRKIEDQVFNILSML
jgi:hypothetical protein